jgi:hypothetical protein
MTNQAGNILYQTVSSGALDASIPTPEKRRETVISNIAESTKKALQEKTNADVVISPLMMRLFGVINPIAIVTSDSINQGIKSLTTITQSGYLAKLTILGRLLDLMKNVTTNVPVERLNFIAKTTKLWESFDHSWANFLWENEFLVSDTTAINNLANLLLAYGQSKNCDQITSLNQSEIIELFEQCRDHEIMTSDHLTKRRYPKRTIFGEDLDNLLGLDCNDCLNWIQEKAKSILGSITVIKDK